MTSPVSATIQPVPLPKQIDSSPKMIQTIKSSELVSGQDLKLGICNLVAYAILGGFSYAYQTFDPIVIKNKAAEAGFFSAAFFWLSATALVIDLIAKQQIVSTLPEAHLSALYHYSSKPVVAIVGNLVTKGWWSVLSIQTVAHHSLSRLGRCFKNFMSHPFHSIGAASVHLFNVASEIPVAAWLMMKQMKDYTEKLKKDDIEKQEPVDLELLMKDYPERVKSLDPEYLKQAIAIVDPDNKFDMKRFLDKDTCSNYIYQLYKALALRFHPDKHLGEEAEYVPIMAQINLAKERLLQCCQEGLCSP